MGLALALAGATPAPAVLPNFAGWQVTQSKVAIAPGWGLPAAEAAVLQEYGLRSAEHATYRRGDRTIEAEGLHFGDAGGAYGAFTFLRVPADAGFDLAQSHDQAAAAGKQIMFTRGEWLVQVDVDQITGMTAAEMRQLAVNLSASAGGPGSLPTLPYYLPRQNLVPNSVKYVEGPAGFAAVCAWLPVSAIGFNMGAEAVVASYQPDTGGRLAMAVVAYPTPQIARTHLGELQKVSGITVRRTGPILVAVQGAGSSGASALLQSVNYDADVTMVPPTPVGIEGLPGLILGIVVLCGLIIAVAVVLGLLTGGIRVLLQRILPERFRPSHTESIIRLHLR